MRKFNITVNGTSYEVEVEEVGGAAAPAQKSAAPAPKPAAPAPAPAAKPAAAPVAGAATIEAPMPGTIVGIKVKAGDTVSEGDVLCVLEAMKMENEIMAPRAGKVAAVCVNQGAAVNTGDALISLS
ncbi:MAG TPA: biotin/lipoyl-binding protein [Candidatus Monoglobus merdigallinarum]|uniref:Biotin carboxyl carrier protein of acetyl-CoA carboxylase n=1 Tax=Candidatus Monoglobus merdigallinarum TaxID=2838698 RepID=A0A9D1TMG3_9FIRM|nr:biotin/lipoyl-binding protein [Candidatus Monoglobus merdigallinarum]